MLLFADVVPPALQWEDEIFAYLAERTIREVLFTSVVPDAAI